MAIEGNQAAEIAQNMPIDRNDVGNKTLPGSGIGL